MPYETLIGWRYIYRRDRSPTAYVGLGLSLAVMGIGTAMFFASPSAPSVFLLAGGALGTVFFGLLCLFSVFTTVSVVGVILGVAALTVVLSVTSGFQKQFRDKVLGVNSHVIIQKERSRFHNYREIEEVAMSLAPEVVAEQPFVLAEMLATRGKGELSGVLLKGIDPARLGKVLDVSDHMVAGSIDVLREHKKGHAPPIIVGRELARKLHVTVGEEITVVSPLSGLDVKTWTSNNKPPKSMKFEVGGIFYIGFDEYDRRLMYVDLEDAQAFLEQGDVVMGVEMRLRNVDDANRIARKLEGMLGDDYLVTDWRQLNQNLFQALVLQKIVLLIFLTLIIVVAAFNMVAALTMIVLDKTKEIAILKSMGGRSSAVARIFQVVGLTIGGIGTLVGLALGLLLCSVLARYGYPLDAQVYLIDRLPIQVNPVEVVFVGLITMVIAFVATLYPAFKASGLHPVEGLRYE